MDAYGEGAGLLFDIGKASNTVKPVMFPTATTAETDARGGNGSRFEAIIVVRHELYLLFCRPNKERGDVGGLQRQKTRSFTSKGKGSAGTFSRAVRQALPSKTEGASEVYSDPRRSVREQEGIAGIGWIPSG
ncbi:MAG: hypothetical protein M1837_001962 [Sclerophora amabilis]|nr:MAG: hypothetical protein M1837_001962 [Sclerophora amabilis]